MEDKIDVVVPWVDGSDIAWIEEKNKWYNIENPDKESNSDSRYQSWDNLKYWFRAIEAFMPWINNIFFITWGHIPQFLDTTHPKIRIVKHQDYIPNEYLPTFNVNTIELNIHRIADLSEKFIYFNDDTFPLIPIERSYYFEGDVPCDEAIETPIIPMLNGEISKYTWNMRALDVSLINRNFNKREVQKRFYEKWFNECYGDLLERNKSLSYWDNFVGFRDPHVPSAFLKSTFERVWEKERSTLNRACETKFRDFSCVNQWLIRYWQLCEGNFAPRKTLGKSYTVTIDNYIEISNLIRNQGHQMICINEECSLSEFEIIKREICSAYEFLLPAKSTFEL